MPVSEDEFERPVASAQPAAMSKAELRKTNKPIMEKRRRARINHCLNELKTLILDALKKDPARHSKLEKADILEMTVKHLQQIQRQHLATAVATDPAVIMRFKSGFDECAAEVSRYIGRMGNVDDGVKQRLIAHLHRCVSSLQQVSVFPQYGTQNCDKTSIVLPSSISSTTTSSSSSTSTGLPGDVNNNNSSNQAPDRIHIPGGLQLIPSRLPTGELALLVPNSNQIASFLNAPPPGGLQFQSVLSPTFAGALNKGPSAFTAVSKNPETEPRVFAEPNDGNVKASQQSEPSDGGVSSSSFQRKPADSTTPTPPTRGIGEEDKFGSFKAFHVDVSDARLGARVTVPGYSDDKIEQKPNPNYTLNPNKAKSPQKYVRTHADSSISAASGSCDPERFSKIEPLSVITDYSPARPRSTEAFQKMAASPPRHGSPARAAKRPLSAGSTGLSPTSTESPGKVSRISLDLTLADDYAGDAAAAGDRCNDRCQRISVIVEDVSKDGVGKRDSGGGASASHHRDMWRPW